MDRPQQPPARLPATVWILGFVSLLMDLSSEIYHALLPAFLTVTLGLPAATLGAIDGIAEATASFAKLASGRLSDRSRRRKPWIVAGYGIAALSKPLFPLANAAWPVLGARFADRVGKGIRASPRDAMIADETPPELRGRAYGLRQSLDTVGATIAPIAAIALMAALAGDIRLVFWIAAVPAFLSFGLALVALREPARHRADEKELPPFRGFGAINAATRRLIAVGFLFSLARFSEGFLILKGMDVGLSAAMSPIALVAFNLGFGLLAYPAGSWSDRVNPKVILGIGMLTLIAANLILAQATSYVALTIGVFVWGGHMAFTQGVFARMIADSAPTETRATSFGAFHFVTGIATLIASVGAGMLWDRYGAEATFLAGAGAAGISLVMLALLARKSGT
ncbi:MAG TPA: MFS transporter [Sphingomicrobium sp.]|nr:MFS transporter [Sphingomicrobium sp.]